MTTTAARFVTQDELDAMDDAAFARFEAECADDAHPDGVTCVMCADERDLAFGLDADDWADRSGGYLTGMWRRSGFGWGDRAATIEARGEALIVGSRMVKAFVNTFATGRGGRYQVTFDPTISTAGVNYDERRIVISPAPVLDDTLTPEDAGIILTAMAVHEASHVRYGTDVATSIRRAFGKRRDYAHPHAETARGLANILEDVRIERRFAADYPGYAHVFAPAAKYVAEAGMRRAGVTVIRPDAERPLAFAGQAIRYAPWCDWSGLEAERDWWTAWADRWADKGTPRQRIAAVREGIEHIPSMENPPVEQPTDEDDTDTTSDPDDTDDDTEDMDDDADGNDEDDDEDDGDGDEDPGDPDDEYDDHSPAPTAGPDDMDDMDDEDDDPEFGNRAPRDDADAGDPDDDMGEDGDDDESDAQREANAAAQAIANDFAKEAFSACPTEAIAAAAIANGVRADDIDGAEAESLVDAAEHMVTVTVDPMGDGEQRAIEVRPAAHLPGIRGRITRDPAVAGAVRNAFIRSRTGHTEMEKGVKRGRCDNRSLPRVANNDYRLFHRRHAPSPGRYFVRMLVDWSASMDYSDGTLTLPSAKVAAVAASIADASRHVDSMRMTVEGWTTPRNQFTGDDRDAVAGLYEAWRSGQPTERIGDLERITKGGTPDVYVLDHAIRTIAAECRDTGETPVIVMLSDGDGWFRIMTPDAVARHAAANLLPWADRQAARAAVTNDPASYYTPEAVTDMMAAARRAGVRVVSVAIGADVNADTQEKVYGRGNYITWQGSMTATAIPLARMLGRMVAS